MANSFGDFGEIIKLARDENFRRFLTNPKVQELMKEDEFKQAVQEKNMFKLMSNGRFMEVMKDPEIRSALEALNKGYREKG